ncbi:MAG: hypothetical protein IJN63_05370, partial [Clostridia bacterium]|nr:hypothetical protein [Clostridia bacterium]
MNLRLDDTGVLRWDAVDGATGYCVNVCKHPGNFLLTTDDVSSDKTSYDLFGKLDELEYDNGDYMIELEVFGSDPEYKSSSLLIYYSSIYEKLQSPANLRWNGNVAEWDAVTNATRYNVYLTNTNSGSITVDSNVSA